MSTPVPPPARRRTRALLLAVALGACGPYAQLAQKLDVTARIAGDTWIAAVGPDREEIRVFLVGKPDADGVAPFAFTAIQMPPISAGTAVTTLQGTWTEVGSAGDTTLRVRHTYVFPDESSVPILSRRGTWRDDAQRTLTMTVVRDGSRLVVSGNAALSGTYVPMLEALRALGTSSERDAACAFQIFNLAIQSSEGRIIGFGGPGMTQYQQAETYVGTVAGSLRISMNGFLSSTTDIEYAGFEDFGGVRVNGPQVTHASSSGNGSMSGVMTFALAPLALDPSAPTTITGTVDYGGAGNPADAIQISGGNAVGGVYVTSIDGGGTARVDGNAASVPSPTAAECLALP